MCDYRRSSVAFARVWLPETSIALSSGRGAIFSLGAVADVPLGFADFMPDSSVIVTSDIF